MQLFIPIPKKLFIPIPKIFFNQDQKFCTFRLLRHSLHKHPLLAEIELFTSVIFCFVVGITGDSIKANISSERCKTDAGKASGFLE